MPQTFNGMSPGPVVTPAEYNGRIILKQQLIYPAPLSWTQLSWQMCCQAPFSFFAELWSCMMVL